MFLGSLLADVLPDLEFAQAANQPRTKNEREEHRGQAGVDRPDRDVTKDVEGTHVAPEHFDEEVVKHLVPYLLSRRFLPSSVPSDQRFDNLLHLHSARTLYQQQITGSHECFQELGSFLRRCEKLCPCAWEACGNSSFHDLGCVSSDADDPIYFSRFRGILPSFAMQLRRSGPQFAHLTRNKNAPLKVRSGCKQLRHRLQRCRARVVAVVDQRSSIRESQ